MDKQEITPAGLARLLYAQECPAGYKCLAMDCLKCLEMYAEKGKPASE